MGSEHPLTLRSMHNMAKNLNEGNKEQCFEAVQLIKRAIIGRSKVLGSLHKETLESLSLEVGIKRKQSWFIMEDLLVKCSTDESAYEELYLQAQRSKTKIPWDFATHNLYLEDIIQSFSGNILDVGCGYGENTAWLAQLPNVTKVTGVDISPTAIKEATRRSLTNLIETEKLLFHSGNILDLENLSMSQYDTILDSSLFHCFDDHMRLKYVDSLKSYLKVNGRLVLLAIGELTPDPYSGPKRLSKDYISTIWSEAGFRVDSIEDVSTNLSNWKHIRMIATKL